MSILGLISLVLICLIPFEGQGSQTTGHQEGQRFASTLDRALSNKVGDIPGYTGSNPQEAGLRASQLSNQAESLFRKKNSAAEFLMSSESNRAQFDIDPNKDPLLKASHGAVSNAEGFLNLETESVEDQPTDYVEVKCIKPLEFTFTIDRRYTPKILVRKKSKTFSTSIDGNTDCPLLGWIFRDWPSYYFQNPEIFVEEGCGYAWNTRIPGNYLYPAARRRIVSLMRGRIPEITADKIEEITQIRNGGSRGSHNYGTISGVYEVKTREVQENWTTSFYGFEDYLDHGDYTLIDESIVEGPGTRTVDGGSVTADAWNIQETYMSKGSGPNTCSALLERGCEQTGSVCIEEINGQCVKVENTFRCPDKVRRLRRSKLNGDGVFCLDGNCTDVAWQDNTDMMDALSKLALFQEMQKNMKEGRVFKGNKMSCSKHCWGFSNCCQVSGGWGESIGFTKCSETEKELALLRGEKKCRYVGTYCSEKINLGFTKVCIMKKSTYCCFGNKLTRLIQEQGRSQLKMGWGSAKCPNCRGLTAEELTAIDFDQLDLQEAFEDIKESLEIPNPSGVVNRFESSWKNRLPTTQEKAIQHREQGKEAQALKVKYGESL